MSPAKPYDGPRRVGTIRPSQAIHSYGVGAMIDLPNMSVIIGGLERWDDSHQSVVTEDRLLAAVQARLGEQVTELRSLPAEPQTTTNPFDAWARVGLPVTVFPRWMRCTGCNRLFPLASGALHLEHNPHRIDKTCYIHSNCDRRKGRPPRAVPARFVTGCANGHLDEFPWVSFAHRGTTVCANPVLRVNDVGTGGRATDLQVACLTCDAKATVATAFGPSATDAMPQCRGRHPHLGQASEPCGEQLRTLVLGASNLWFSSTVAALSLPVGGGSLAQLVHDHWAVASQVTSRETLTFALGQVPALADAFAGENPDDIWAAIEVHRAGGGPPPEPDVFGPEWKALTEGTTGVESPHFVAEVVVAPASFDAQITSVTLAHRLRVVTALCGFNRISAGEPDDPKESAPIEKTGEPEWVPVVENRGEGIFIRLDEDAVQQWESIAETSPMITSLRRAHADWRSARNLEPNQGWLGARYVLLHSLSHALINELAIECGYSSASIRERLYCRPPGVGPEPMAGVLFYTSAPDVEGTLGGLVNLGKPAELGPILERAVGRAGLCSADPLCADHEPHAATSALHAAACHACLLVSETSCERANRYLDRSVLVDTFRHTGLEFFG